jgi:hypothetical protein
VVLTLELLACGTDTGDYVRHVAQHSGKEQKAEQELYDDEQVFKLAAWTRQVSNSGEGQGTPIITLQVLFDDICCFTVPIHPVLTTECVILVDDVIQTTVPVEDN